MDAAQLAPHRAIDVRALDVDFLFFALYKVYGPHLGVMVLRRELNRDLPYQGHFFNEEKPGYRFTPAGPVGPGCGSYDFASDDDVDLADFASVQEILP